MYKLLDHISIVELSAYVAMPLAGLTLAGFGAHVTKILPPEGPPDQTRWPIGPDGKSIFWRELNKRKSIIEADLRSADGQKRLVDSIESSDRIVIINISLPSAISPQSLVNRFEDLICIELVGKFDGSSAVDYTVQPLTGIPSVTGPVSHNGPIMSVVPTWDIAAGYLSATSVLAALEHRRRTGKGAWIRISLYSLAMATLSNLGYLGDYQENGKTRPRVGNGIYGTFAQDFTSSDEQRLLVVAITPRQWQALIKVSGEADRLVELERQIGADFSDEGQRYLHSGAIHDVLAPWFRARTLGEIAAALKHTQLAWAPFLSLAEGLKQFVSDPASAAILERTDPAAGLSAGIPVIIQGELRSAKQFASTRNP
ncbi:MAG: CoA transferase [Hyphomicrobiales bacterium]|nr:CoA transferase [Hyphomicrobiales bacterium]